MELNALKYVSYDDESTEVDLVNLSNVFLPWL